MFDAPKRRRNERKPPDLQQKRREAEKRRIKRILKKYDPYWFIAEYGGDYRDYLKIIRGGDVRNDTR